MIVYNVREVASMLNVSAETVRRWIRTGWLEADQSSRKEGNLITKESLNAFCKNHPKYTKNSAAEVRTENEFMWSYELIKILKEDLHITWNEVADILSENRSNLYNKVKHKSKITVDTLLTFVSAFQYGNVDFIGGWCRTSRKNECIITIRDIPKHIDYRRNFVAYLPPIKNWRKDQV